jgi:hypothetical protein
MNKVFKSPSCAREHHKACRHACEPCHQRCMCSCHSPQEPVDDDVIVITLTLDARRQERRAA